MPFSSLEVNLRFGGTVASIFRVKARNLHKTGSKERSHNRRCEKLESYICKKKFFLCTLLCVKLHFSGIHLLHKLRYAVIYNLCLRPYIVAKYAWYRPSKLVEAVTLLALFCRWSFRISAGIPSILTDIILRPSSQMRG
jgi:hypothetical protein